MSCRVYGNLCGINGVAIANATVKVSLTICVQYSDPVTGLKRIILPQSMSVVTNDNGDWEFNLLDNENMKDSASYKFEFIVGVTTYTIEKYIPNVDSAEFTTLSDRG
jgi:hypothetical protein